MMPEPYTAESLLRIVHKGLLGIGYRDDLLLPDYAFAEIFGPDAVRRIDLAAFAQDPPSYRTSCFGIVIQPANASLPLLPYRALGAPHILTLHPETSLVRRWKMVASGEPEFLDQVDAEHVESMIRQNESTWRPERILRAKSIAFTSESVQLDFFDTGLLPLLEGTVHKKLDRLLRNVIASSQAIYTELFATDPNYEELFRLMFRFIAAKLLADRKYPGPWADPEPKIVIQAVDDFYFRHEASEMVLQQPEVQENAWSRIRTAFHFQNISVEALAYVYENTFVTPSIRKKQDIHATPYGIAEYIVQRLPIHELPPEDRRIFEPFAGHAPFLIAGLGRLRALLSPDTSPQARHEYFVRMLSGMEIDSFSREVARYSLILADYPNPDGWRIANSDAFTDPNFDTYLSQANIVLCNPPFSSFSKMERASASTVPNKAVEALRRVLMMPPAMLGFVLPRAFITGQSFRETHQQVVSLYKNTELVTLPDNVFHHSEVETVLVLAYGRDSDIGRRRASIVEKPDYEQFIRIGRPTWSDEKVGPDASRLWYSPLQEVWEQLEHLPILGQFVDIHRGIEFRSSLRQDDGRLISEVPRQGYRPGLATLKDGFEPYNITAFRYLNADPKEMRGDAYKQPWDQPKVIANAVRSSRGPWTVEGVIDDQGLWAYQNFHGLWQKDSFPHEIIAAILNGPVANAYVSTHRTGAWHNQKQVVERIPVPRLTPHQTQLISELVQRYRSLRSQWYALPDRAALFMPLCREVLWQIDAELLAAYDLPLREERNLLDYFTGHQRPGPVEFREYFPKVASPSISWHTYVTDQYGGIRRRTVDELADQLRDMIFTRGEAFQDT